MLAHTIGSRRIRYTAVVLAILVTAGACNSDDDTGPVRPVRLPPTTITEGEPAPNLQEPPRPVEPLPPPEAEQP